VYKPHLDFWPIFGATLHEKHFLLNDIVQDLPVLADMHVPTLASVLHVLGLLVLDLCETLFSLFVIFIP